jgi:2-dehydro-3-deoxyphosphogluconate aldolase/(4S)-4-hydroxy-2-oxoglutarate aldolase
MSIRDITDLAPVIPIITIDDAATAVPLARALVAGGLPVIEVTLRTEPALAAARAMIAEVPEAVIGLGTVTRRDHIAAALDIGARFLVSPGFSAEMADLARQSKLPFLPGIATASELMAALDFGFSILKFFPAEPAGGIDMLRALHGPFPDALFCPTGGIDAAKAPSYLELPNVVAVGGSWVAPRTALIAKDWQKITALARAARDLRKR